MVGEAATGISVTVQQSQGLTGGGAVKLPIVQWFIKPVELPGLRFLCCVCVQR